MPTADELMELARACAGRLELDARRRLPVLEDVEEEATEEYGALLDALQEDEVLGGVDLDRQNELMLAIEKKLAEEDRPLVEELGEQHTKHVWVLQEAAFHVGVAVGMRLAGARRSGDAGA
jgi:hypothetical protein